MNPWLSEARYWGQEFMGSEFFFAGGYRENYSDPINGAMEYNMVRKEPFASTALRSPILGVRVTSRVIEIIFAVKRREKKL